MENNLIGNVMGELKYHQILSENQFDFSKLAEKEQNAFRFVKEDITHADNFKPPALLRPLRNNNPKEICSDYGISFFDNKDKAIERFNHLKKRKSNIALTLGSHLAEGDIIKEHGLCTKPSKSGHFDLHEYCSCPSFTNNFKIQMNMDELC